MMKYIKSENGYALLLTLLILIVFTVLGMSVLGMSLSGTERNNTREEIVQSNDLATKGIDYITAQITSELNTQIATSGITASSYITKLNTVINSFKCVGGTSISRSASLGSGTKYEVCIQKIENDPDSKIEINSSTHYLRKLITFKSIGYSNDSTETLYAKYNIGASQHPEVLNYAVGTFNNSYGNGNLYLNGGIYIQGDVQVAGDLVTSDYGITRTFNTNENPVKDFSHPSLLPQINSVNANSSPKLYVEGDLFSLKDHNNWDYLRGSIFNYNIYTTSDLDALPNGKVEKIPRENVSNLFYNTVNPTLLTVPSKVEAFEFEPKKTSIYFTKAQATQKLQISRSLFNPDFDVTEESTATSTYLSAKCIFCNEDNQTFTFRGKNSFNKLATGGSIRMRDEGNHAFNKGAYITGDVEIGNPLKSKSFIDSFKSTCDKNNSMSPISVSGIVYVKGNLTMCNVELTSNVIFYVEGDVTITESKIIGKEENARTTSLIIFSKGDINLSNNSVNEKDPSKIKGYFYTEKVMEIYGVGSNIEINGGIAASKIILNGIRGDNIGGVYATKSQQESMSSSESRLRIIYDKDIINNYSALDFQTEILINKIAPPVELERSYTPPPN